MKMEREIRVTTRLQRICNTTLQHAGFSLGTVAGQNSRGRTNGYAQSFHALQHTCNTLATRLQHACNTPATQLQHTATCKDAFWG